MSERTETKNTMRFDARYFAGLFYFGFFSFAAHEK